MSKEIMWEGHVKVFMHARIWRSKGKAQRLRGEETKERRPILKRKGRY